MARVGAACIWPMPGTCTSIQHTLTPPYAAGATPCMEQGFPMVAAGGTLTGNLRGVGEAGINLILASARGRWGWRLHAHACACMLAWWESSHRHSPCLTKGVLKHWLAEPRLPLTSLSCLSHTAHGSLAPSAEITCSPH